MKKSLSILFFCLFISTQTFAQMEFAVSFNSSLFSFGGKAAESSSFINASDVATLSGYTNNPYGTKNGLGYGLSINSKRVFAKHFLLGLDAGYEMMRSKIDINGINSFGPSGSTTLPATGKTNLNTQFINLHPNLGFRFGGSSTTFDLTAGMDVGIVLDAKEKGKAETTNGGSITTNTDRKNLNTDLRPRLQLAANYQKFSAHAGYAYGLSNYRGRVMCGGAEEVQSRVIRFGVAYRIN
jgi:hypothetical protein